MGKTDQMTPVDDRQSHAPIAIGLIAVIHCYRLTMSGLFGRCCRFEPSCSAYAMEAVKMYGCLKGCFLAARRLLRCHPWCPGGVDLVP